jgi:ferredoxin-type protein NapH
MERIELTVKKLLVPIVILLSFWSVAVFLWRNTGNAFYIFNFGYIGFAVALGLGLYIILPRKRKALGRRIAQLLVGGYLLVFLGLLGKENMQIEGFFFHLLAGYFAASVIHYLVAKVGGPLLYGRGYCGWACWTAMVLDFLPFKRNKAGRLSKKWEWLRYAHFGISLTLVLVLWYFLGYQPDPVGSQTLICLIGGNALYFSTSIILAFVLKDNRAFCKYLCPVAVVLKVTARFSMLKVEGKTEECSSCGACSKACPMDIDVMAYVKNGQRVLSTECIVCHNCTNVCPKGILDTSFKFDIGGTELIRRREQVETNELSIPSNPVDGTGGSK